MLFRSIVPQANGRPFCRSLPENAHGANGFLKRLGSIAAEPCTEQQGEISGRPMLGANHCIRQPDSRSPTIFLAAGKDGDHKPDDQRTIVNQPMRRFSRISAPFFLGCESRMKPTEDCGAEDL